MSAFRLLLALSFFATQLAGAWASEPLPFDNLDFKDWVNGRPDRWVGFDDADSGGQTPSRIRRLPGGGVELSGDASTGKWAAWSQSTAVREGSSVRLRFEARAEGLKREGRQFDNCYVGMREYDSNGERLKTIIRNISEPAWAPGHLVVKVSDSTASVEVVLFLSKTGALQVRNLRLEQIKAEDSFDVLVEEMDRYYSFFALKGVNWHGRAAAYQAAGRKAQTGEEFIAAVQPLLAELKDLHLSITDAEGKSIPTYPVAAERNFEARAIAAKLKGVKQVGKMGFVGRTDEGFGYVVVGSLSADENTTAKMLAAFDSLLDAKGLIVDLRVNGGGDERIALQFVSRLVSEPLVYASHKVRGGAAYDNFLPPINRRVTPRAGQPYRGPVVGLIGRGCVSSGEAFAMMLRALPQTKLIGQPTRGASGNPQPIALPNGVTVHYPIWIALQLDGKPLEGVGIAPDVTIDEDPTGIKGLQAAVEELKRRAK